MESEQVRDNDVYGLVVSLCDNIFRSNCSIAENEQSYLPRENYGRHLRRLKAKAYEILLNKSPHDYGKNSKECGDPVVELLKHVFVLKIEAGHFSQATELQQYLDLFIDEGLEQDSVVYSTLQFLNCLKSIGADNDNALDIFYYDTPHPSLPEMYSEGESIPPYQIYPAESFHLPKQFENMFKQEQGSFVRYNSIELGSQLSLLGRFTEPTIKSIRLNNDINSNAPKYTANLPRGMNLELTSSFLLQIKDIERSEGYLQPCIEGIVTEPESPWQGIDPLQSFIMNNQDNLTEIHEIEENEIEHQVVNLDKVWEDMDKISPVPNHATWETLGSSQPTEEPPFASECVEATIHLMNIAQDTLFNHDSLNHPITIVPSKIFINNIKLLLLGIESSTFIYNQSGFELNKNMALEGISSETLQNICIEITYWGTCFKNLSNLIVVDPKTGKLQIEGLIFKALCSSIKEFLLFYHAAILKVSITESENIGLLSYLKKVRPLGNLIMKIAKLCRCDSQISTSLDEGIGILTHIYKEVTKVTEQNVALVFYSILKDCCEVYFRFLQQWIFEGVCTDIYDEFMITIRPKYVRTRGYRFWTKAFSINSKSVPGFLSDLTDSILQCGKAVMLLKICDPQNPLCRVSASNHPHVRVCLSVGMLREQAKFYEEYMTISELEQGEEVSMHTAIQQQKECEKKRAELVMAAQQDTLQRLKKEREDSLRKIMKEKIKLLEELKDQAEEAAQRKERERDAELLADKLLLEKIQKHEEEAKALERAEREKTIKYYHELSEEASKRKIHAEWRIRRMKLFDDRLESICEMRREFSSTPDSEQFFNINQESILVKAEEAQKEKIQEKVSVEENENVDTKKIIITVSIDNENKEFSNKDENSNPTCTTTEVSSSSNQSINSKNNENQSIHPTNDENQNISIPDQISRRDSEERTTTTKAVRPTVLNITGINTQKYMNDRRDGLQNDKTITDEKSTLDLLKLSKMDNMMQAQRNKFKVLQQEFGLTPNNNESSTIMFAIENNNQQGSELTEIQRNRLRNTQHLTHLNWNDEETVSVKDESNEPSSEGKTEIQMNRLRNTQHLTDFNYNETTHTRKNITEKSRQLTEAEINRNRVMSHFYNRMDDFEPHPHSLKPENLTDYQRNRNRNMAHNIERFDFDLNSFAEPEHQRETPMSTTTDHFTTSTHSGSMQVHSCENTPFSEYANHSEAIGIRLSDVMSTDGTASQQSHGSKYFQDIPVFPNFFGFGSMLNTPANENQQQQQVQLTVADVEMIDTTSLHVYLEKSVLVPLRVQSRLVNNAIIKYLLNEHNMLSHLHSLRSYFFLLNGEFAKTLTQSLFTRLYEVSVPLELFNSSTLMSLLEKALISSLSNTYANSELLSLSVTEVPAYLQTSNPQILNCLSLNYKISWPLNIIFNDVVMQQYSRVFKFLLMVGRVLWVLQEDFQILKIARKTSISNNHHKLQLYRHSMMQFTNALHTYLTCGVLHASWSEFERDLENTKTLDDVYDTHVRYIKKILSRCMLTMKDEKMRTCLCNIFKLILKFHNRIRSQNWSDESKSAIGLNYKDLERMYLAFCEQRQYLAHVAEKVANCGYQSHLQQFLHALNINHRYNFVAKK